MKQILIRARRHACRGCGCRPARYQYRGVVKCDRFHELCFRCFRSLADARRARVLAAATTWAVAPRH